MSHIFSIAFYNLENLFDYENKESTLDKDYTPEGIYQWDRNKYFHKINNLGNAISKIGETRSTIPPVIIGVCEVESETCLMDLVQTEALKPFNYDYVFYKSSDQRGIHVAFLFQREHFICEKTKSYPVDLSKKYGPDTTRDIMLIKGKLFHKNISILINHWPSRTDGTKKTNNKRLEAAKLVQHIIHNIKKENQESNIVIMGDFNDDPRSESVKTFESDGFFNPMIPYQEQKKGSVRHKGKWIMFDQILLNKNLLESAWFEYLDAQIYVAPFLTQKSGRHKGSPKRTFNGKFFQGGFSDHYPVFIYFKVH